jgi:spore coat protein A
MNRRDFLKAGAASGILLPLARPLLGQKPYKRESPIISKSPVSDNAHFRDPLPIPPVRPRQSYYEVTMTQFKQKLHQQLPPTTVWGYDGSFLGPTFDMRRGTPISVKWINNLPSKHILPVDTTLHGCEPPTPEVRTVVHVHGHRVAPESDGYPEAWFTNGFAQVGPAFKTQVYDYPNDQRATMLWYHDHALGITRLNVAAGLVGIYFIRDEVEDALGLPQGAPYEVPLVLMDRSFTNNGQIAYSGTGVTSYHPVWIPEYFGDADLVNGKVWPYLEVEPRKYRFRVLNAANARFYHLQTRLAPNDTQAGPPFIQIGADQGFLPAPVTLPSLLMSPAERADIVIDFSGFAGQSIDLINDAATPYPDGDPTNNARVIQFRVTKPLASSSDFALPAAISSAATDISETEAVKVRDITLNEIEDPVADAPIVGLLENTHWADPVTVSPKLGTIEKWRFINTTADTHPIHVHLVDFKILRRRKFDVDVYNNTGNIVYTGPEMPPDPNEVNAPKDTVRVDQGTITEIAMKFTLPKGVIAPSSGNSLRYVFHCHILEHEDNEMMRPMDVIA